MYKIKIEFSAYIIDLDEFNTSPILEDFKNILKATPCKGSFKPNIATTPWTETDFPHQLEQKEYCFQLSVRVCQQRLDICYHYVALFEAFFRLLSLSDNLCNTTVRITEL